MGIEQNVGSQSRPRDFIINKNLQVPCNHRDQKTSVMAKDSKLITEEAVLLQSLVGEFALQEGCVGTTFL